MEGLLPVPARSPVEWVGTLPKTFAVNQFAETEEGQSWEKGELKVVVSSASFYPSVDWIVDLRWFQQHESWKTVLFLEKNHPCPEVKDIQMIVFGLINGWQEIGMFDFFRHKYPTTKTHRHNDV